MTDENRLSGDALMLVGLVLTPDQLREYEAMAREGWLEVAVRVPFSRKDDLEEWLAAGEIVGVALWRGANKAQAATGQTGENSNENSIVGPI